MIYPTLVVRMGKARNEQELTGFRGSFGQSWNMGVLQHRNQVSERVLAREVEIPLPTMGRSPMAVVGACLVFFFLAAMVDALLWQVSADREQLRIRAESAEAAAVEMEWRLSQLAMESGNACPSAGADEALGPDAAPAAIHASK